ncbi:MAG: hypothetical protein HQM13_14920 [SAR324 cluster bacterium]|nr:hypothetical protein [SAR324 cluster bacterium]
MARLIITGVFVIALGFGLFFWNGNSQSEKGIENSKKKSLQMSHQLKEFLEEDQSSNFDEETNDRERNPDEKVVNFDEGEKEQNSSSLVPIVQNKKSQIQEKPIRKAVEQPPKKKSAAPKENVVRANVNKRLSQNKPSSVQIAAQKNRITDEVETVKKPDSPQLSRSKQSPVNEETDPSVLATSRKAAKFITTFTNQSSSNSTSVSSKSGLSSFDSDEEILDEDEEIAYQDAYKRSLYKDPYDREFVLENVEAYHGDLASALTKLDIDQAVRENDLDKLQRWLKILTIAKYPLEQKRLTESYKGTRSYIKTAIRRMLN